MPDHRSHEHARRLTLTDELDAAVVDQEVLGLVPFVAVPDLERGAVTGRWVSAERVQVVSELERRLTQTRVETLVARAHAHLDQTRLAVRVLPVDVDVAEVVARAGVS